MYLTQHIFNIQLYLILYFELMLYKFKDKYIFKYIYIRYLFYIIICNIYSKCLKRQYIQILQRPYELNKPYGSSSFPKNFKIF